VNFEQIMEIMEIDIINTINVRRS